MASIGKVSAVFTASTSGLTAGVKAAGSSFRGLQSDTKGLESAMRTLVAINATQLFASVASSALSSVRSLVSFGQAQADVVDNASKLAARLGMTYGEFAGLSLAADLAGVSMDTIGAASQKAEIAFAKAAGGSKIATAAFAGLGLSVEQLNGMSAADRFDAIAASIAALPTEAQRAAAAVQLFGKAGADLLPLFAGASGSIDEAVKKAVELGIAVNNVDASQAVTAFDQLNTAASGLGGFVISADASQALDSIGLVSDSLVGLTSEQRFAAIGEAIGQLPTEAARAAAAVRVFGSAGEDLAPIFASSISPIAAARAEAERLGLTLTNAQGQNVEAMNDSFTMVQKSIQGVVQQVVAYLAPAITAISEQFTTLVGNIGGANIGQAIGAGILQGARFLAGVGDYLIQNFGSTFSYLSQVGQQWGDVGDLMNRTASFLSGVFNGAQAGLGMIILGFTGAFEGLATIAKEIGSYLGFDTSTLDSVVAGAAAFNQTLSDGITANVEQMQAGFSGAFADNAPQVGQAIAGPLVTSLDASIARAEEAASSVDVASKKPVELNQTVVVDVAQAIKGIDSRSTEGITEMFRIMRGGAGDVQEQQLSVLEEIRDELAASEGITVAEVN